ncbi:Oidioi.mRNA.OKI2018_I69.PAR.g10722.t1.cds [Oikopleura dioica]|uniref:Oidioi.mRNA.OKI2018_I69.PAR.g10722.t1.cds n=1 Tax=Oikopleura dioica TaxID=34765 RepID=A0ABN7RVH5_OIKDI|nr:Oidioi.mRNA.OKI2018_I69.PAR.g10722.t1.cds [Oikopleura dioica]
MRDHQLSQVVPLDLPSIQGVTFVQTTDDDNNNKECITITGDLKLDPEFYEEAEDGEMIQQEKDEWDE